MPLDRLDLPQSPTQPEPWIERALRTNPCSASCPAAIGGGDDVKRRMFLASGLVGSGLRRMLAAEAAPQPVRIGWLTAQQASSLAPYVDAFRAGLADLGYVEGRNLTIDFRYGDDAGERVPA